MTTTEPLGILAGSGQLPLEIARQVSAGGRPVHIVRLAGEPGEDLQGFPHTHVPWGAIGALLKAFRDHGCREIVVAGGVKRPDLRTIAPDWGLVTALPAIIRLIDGGDDSVLRRVVKFFEGQGLVVRGLHEVAPALLIAPGAIGPHRLTPDDEASIETGFAVIAALAALDIGQAVVMAGRRPIAVEGAEGTDRMLARVRPEGARAVLVKRPKPGQELRVDLPAIGARTVEAAAAAGLAGIGVEARKVIAVDRAAMAEQAASSGLFVWATAAPAGEDVGAPMSPQPAWDILTRRTPKPRHMSDVALGRAAIATLAPWVASSAAVVIGGYVVAVGAGEAADAVLARAGGLRPWGFSSRRGMAVVDAPPSPELIVAAADAGLAGIAFLAPLRPDHRQTVADQAAVSRLVVLAAPESRNGSSDG